MQHKVGYVVMFAAAVCVVCAVMVSASAVTLKERQRTNQALDRQRNALLAAGLVGEGESISRERIRSLFDEKVKPVVVDLETGEVVDDPQFEVATYDPERAAEDPELGRSAPPNRANVRRVPKYGVVFHVLDDRGNVDQIVIPIKGYGLWSTLYGYLALDRDTTTIRGITYYQHGETPGLGGEVDNPRWKAAWDGRKAYDDNWEPAIEVIKGQAGPPSADPHRVDGLSGATITARGVTHMMDFWLGGNGFGPYLESFRRSAQ